MSKLMTTKFPLLLILVEMAAQLKTRGLDLGLQWIPRDQNEEADALTNSRFEDFDPANRIEVDVDNLNWMILPKMMSVPEDVHRRVTERREQKRKDKEKAPREKKHEETKAPRLKPGERLRARDPW